MPKGKSHSRFVTAEMRANALVNAEKHDWVREQRERAVSEAEEWMGRTDEALWAMVPAQELPRTIYTNEGTSTKGQQPFCPGCGTAAPEKHGRSWWSFEESRPWKVACMNCGEVYPKNDFEAFYKTALDKHGMFRRELGDRTLLFNTDHADPADPLHKLYVDDGYGMFDEQEKRHDVIAYYCFDAVWRQIQAGVKALAEAFALTSDTRYAHKAAVLLDRIADVYPEMDFLPLFKMGFQHSQGGTGEGGIEGCIWETFVAQGLARSFDIIFDGIQGDEDLVAFCAGRSEQHELGGKASVRAISDHIRDKLLLKALNSSRDGKIRGNTGMTQCSLAVSAIALDDPELTPQWLDWLFHPDYPGEYNDRKDPVSWVLTEGLDRDGMGGECGGYGLIWTRHMRDLVTILSAYPEYTKHNLVAEYPKLKQAFLVESRINVLDGVMPNTGDSGAVGVWGRKGDASTYALAFQLYGDKRFADLAWHEHKAHGSSLRLADDIYREEPDVLAREIEAVAQGSPPELRSEHFGRYGQAHLQTGTSENGRALSVHYGYKKGHSHRDGLNLGLWAKNVDMIPDLGYPEYAGHWPKRGAWTGNTISHNTLLVGDTGSGASPGGKVEQFVIEPPLRLMQVNAPDAYEEVETYRRTSALVDVGDGDSYVLDVFRAKGGSNHRLSWHGAGEAAQADGLELVRQETGTFAGPDVAFATLEDVESGPLYRSGFSYLYDVERSDGQVASPYTVDWKIEDIRDRIGEGEAPHLRLHALTPCDEVALATGDSPRRLQRPKYLIQSRLGEDVQSQFVNVLEPYDTHPFVCGVQMLTIQSDKGADGAVAVAVDLADGRRDILISCEQEMDVTVEGGIRFNGTFGMIRLVDGKVHLMRMVGGTLLAYGETELTAGQAAWCGRVVGVDASQAENNLVLVDQPLPQDAGLVGRTAHFITSGPVDTSYEIKGLTAGGISTGDITIVKGCRSDGKTSDEYTYLVNPGDEYVVPAVTATGASI